MFDKSDLASLLAGVIKLWRWIYHEGCNYSLSQWPLASGIKRFQTWLGRVITTWPKQGLTVVCFDSFFIIINLSTFLSHPAIKLIPFPTRLHNCNAYLTDILYNLLCHYNTIKPFIMTVNNQNKVLRMCPFPERVLQGNVSPVGTI